MDSDRETPQAVDLVVEFLKGQNLEQLGRVDEAVALYEHAVTAGFDSPGPYDRLIEIYSQRAAHLEAARVAEAALVAVHTHSDKYRWYESMAEAARRAAHKVPTAAPKKGAE
jgi:tetratricopeptide (TPR) repeat protein